MDIEVIIQQLLDENVELDVKVKLVTKLNAKIEDADVLFELATCFRAKSLKIHNPYYDTIDIVGTGGDGASTLNYSTLSALVAHKYGLPVAKHGNRATTSKCGSFDFLERLNIEIPTTPEEANKLLDTKRLVFLFAPYFYPIFKPVVEVRKVFAAKGEKTIFNVLGPLLIPEGVKRVVIGVYDMALLEPMAEVLLRLGVEYGYVVYGAGLDEFSVCGVSSVIRIKEGVLSCHSLHPEQVGFTRSKVLALAAGDSYQNYKESKEILCGDLMGPKRDMLVLNAAAAIQVGKGFDQKLSFYVDEVNTLLDKGICLEN